MQKCSEKNIQYAGFLRLLREFDTLLSIKTHDSELRGQEEAGRTR